MTWDNVDFKNGVYRVTNHVIYPRIKGEKPYLADSPSKNEGDGGFFLSYLRGRSLDVLKKLKEEATCNLIFHKNRAFYTLHQISWAYEKAFKIAGLPYSGTHVCRHTGATNFLEETGDPLALQQHGNWSKLEQAMHYGQIMKNRVRNAIREADKKGIYVCLMVVKKMFLDF